MDLLSPAPDAPLAPTRGPRFAAAAALIVLAWCCASPATPASASPPPRPAQVEPALLELERATPGESTLVWVSFTDKGARDEADLALRLARAELALTPRARARRERARVAPLVDERDLPIDPGYLAALEASGLRPFAASRWLNRVAVNAPAEALAPLATLPFVSDLRRVSRASRSLEPDPVSRWLAPLPQRASAGDAATLNYGLTQTPILQLRADALHDSGYTGAGVLVAVLDEGFNAYQTHEALVDRAPAPGRVRDFVEGDTTVTDVSDPAGHSHGTWTTGCIVGHKPGKYLGTAFDAEIALARTEVHPTEEPVEMLYWAQAAEWADSLGADVISSSLGYFTFDPAFSAFDYVYADMNGHTTDISRAAQIAASKGILLVNSVGNEGNTTWHYLIAPADVNGDSLIAVGAVDAGGAVAGFSSFGPSADGRVKPDLVALGVSNPLVSADGNATDYEAGSGTSFSAPLIAGLAACLLQARPAWTPSEVIRALRETASRASAPNNREGYGIPNGATALCWGAPGTMNAPPPPGKARVLGPNPLRSDGPPVHVRFTAGGVNAGPMHAHIRVFDLRGRVVRALWSGTMAYGDCVDVSWDGRSSAGERVSPGIYYIALDVGGEVGTAKIVALK